ncbi:MAG: pimeloyl-ACP methyl ester carboxylesterase [Cellvibrionaceae bacterium]|jgi:pimeloyl-ACP methyl ester carboxylesterase
MKKYSFILLISLLFALGACGGFEDDEFYDDESFDEEYPISEQEDYDDYEEDYEESEPAEEEPEIAEESVPQRPAAQQDGEFVEGDCPFSSQIAQQYNLTCGMLHVPENRESGSDKMIQLAVTILPAANGNPEPDPVIYLDGGPGGSAVAGFESDPDGWAQYGFAQNRDLVLFDQRGTGYSIPELDCDESDENADAYELAETCKASLEAEGIDLSAYNSVESAADVAALANALGYDTYNLLGISYGTRLGLAVMRDHPEGLRSVVLDSPFPPNANPAETEAALTWGRFEAILDACAEDSDCAVTFPNLEQKLLDTVDAMNQEPVDEIYGDDLVALIQQMLFSADEYAFLIPLLIDQASQGNLDLYFELEPDVFAMAPAGLLTSVRQTNHQIKRQDVDDGETDGDAQGMYNSVMCHDEFAFADIDTADAYTANNVPDQLYTGLFLGTVDQFSTCDVWDVGSAEAYVDAAVVSDIPTLVLVGEFDTATPPVWGELTVETLSNGILAQIPSAGHSLVSTNDCAISLMDAFFNNPTSLDTSCIDQIEPLYFELQ